MSGIRKQSLLVAYQSMTVTMITLIGSLSLILLQYFFTDFDTLAGNMGLVFAIIEGVSGILLAILFGVNLGLLWYKLRLASGIKAAESGKTLLGGFLGLLVTGCPACSITIASYLGLAGILSALPFSGLEIKLGGLVLLAYSTDDLLRHLLTCQTKPSKKKKLTTNQCSGWFLFGRCWFERTSFIKKKCC